MERIYLREAGHYSEHNIELIAGVAATAIDADARHVKLADGRTLAYEKLLLATGGQALRLPLPGEDLENVFTLRTIEDSEQIRAAASNGKRALVMGGSFIGAEAAASLAQMGREITEIFPESRLLELIVPPEVSEHLDAMYAEHGIRVLPGVVSEGLEGDGRVEHWDVARRQGMRAGRNMAGESEPYTALPYFFSDLFDLSFEVWGNLAHWDRAVLRGSLASGSFAYFYFNQDHLTGVLAVGRPDAERIPMQSLIKAQPTYDEVAGTVQDESIDLAEIAGSAALADARHDDPLADDPGRRDSGLPGPVRT